MNCRIAKLLVFLLGWWSAGPALAQQQPPPVKDDPLAALQSWMQENLDDSVLQALQQVDQERVRQFFTLLQARFADTNIYELGSIKEAADRALPVLLQFEETRPYGEWLQTHLDYLEAAREMQQEMKSIPPVKPCLPPAPLLRPTPQVQKKVWTRTLSARPMPPLAQRYVPQLKQIFVEEKLPPELVWVAEVESAFNPGARSPVGAAGMFQLMPATAKSLNLSAWPSDERLEPDKNARAAAKYLRQLHGHYHDWPLALAAYNAGEGRVDNLLRKQKSHSFDGIASRLPAETQMYVPKIDATMRKREGHGLAELIMPAAR